MNKRRIALLFLCRFFLSYALLFIGYSIYLDCSQNTSPTFSCDGLTKGVAKHTEFIASWFHMDIQTIQHEAELSMKVLIDDAYIARIVEGCNGAHICILFVAFLFAFKGRLFSFVLFSIFGCLFLYWFNVLRIFLLSILLYKYPEQEVLFHKLLFPTAIYGAVFLLWIWWANRFATIFETLKTA